MSDESKYKFKCINPVDFELRIFTSVKDKAIYNLFIKAREKLHRKRQDIKIGNNYDHIISFCIPDHLFKYAEVLLRNIVRKIENTIKKDGIELIKIDLHEMRYEKKLNNEWDCIIFFTGNYVDKR